MNKKLLSFLLMMLPTLLLTSCLKDQEDKFSESSSERVANYLSNTKKVLIGAENGWVLDLFPDSEQQYGGYSFTMKFDETNVSVCTELAEDVTETITSTYILDNEDGPCIAFDSYNDFIHLFSTPHGSSGAGGYEAYGGDFIFMIMGISEDQNTITLKGNRSGNILYMHRIDESIEDYQIALQNFVNDLVFDQALAEIDGEEYAMLLDIDGREIVFETPEGDEISAMFCFDKDGFTLYEPITIAGRDVQHFKYDEDEGTFTAVEDNSVVFTGLLLPSIVINNVGENIVIGVDAATLEYTFNLADKFNYTSDSDWLTVSAEGKNLTINVTENTTGDTRTGTITVEIDGETATIQISQAPLNQIFVSYSGYFALSKVSTAMQPAFLACKTLSDSESETISVMAMTYMQVDQFADAYGIYFISGNYAGLMALDTEMVGNDKIKFTYNADNNDLRGNGTWYYNHGYKTFIDYLESTTFTITTDSESNPTYFTLTDDSNSSKSFTLTTKSVSNPFSN